MQIIEEFDGKYNIKDFNLDIAEMIEEWSYADGLRELTYSILQFYQQNGIPIPKHYVECYETDDHEFMKHLKQEVDHEKFLVIFERPKLNNDSNGDKNKLEYCIKDLEEMKAGQKEIKLVKSYKIFCKYHLKECSDPKCNRIATNFKYPDDVDSVEILDQWCYFHHCEDKYSKLKPLSEQSRDKWSYHKLKTQHELYPLIIQKVKLINELVSDPIVISLKGLKVEEKK